MTFEFTDMKKIKRSRLGKDVPLELFRAIRLIGMYEGLPMNGKSTTLAIGRKIGTSLPANSVEDILNMFVELKIGIPSIVRDTDKEMEIVVNDCFCEGLPAHEGKMVCDLEGAILEGALSKVWNKQFILREVQCNVNGDEHCKYLIKKLA
ncbi:V4R domain-containing protein [Bacillus marasmi]|uniref:V4R domain-containing protein n=1 Tax=Bacillus marasmi TaxID=1926279 RepID=UPI0011CB9E7E|nr:V4R domain-containing protein [Bacillus marasmi]